MQHDIRVGDRFIKPNNWDITIINIYGDRVDYEYRWIHNDELKLQLYTAENESLSFFIDNIGYRVNGIKVMLDDSLFEVE